MLDTKMHPDCTNSWTSHIPRVSRWRTVDATSDLGFSESITSHRTQLRILTPRVVDSETQPAGSRSGERLRRGVTLVELLVVTAILAILFGTISPALQMFRESARRTSCSNNLRQIALGFVSHADANRELPGWRCRLDSYSAVMTASEPKKAAVSWAVVVLPRIEEEPIYHWYATYEGTQEPGEGLSENQIKTYICPSHSFGEAGNLLSYAANGGSAAEVLDAAESPPSQYLADGVLCDSVGNLQSDPLHDPSRPEYSPGKVSLTAAASDGTAFTLLLTERSGEETQNDTQWSANPRAVRENRGAVVENHVILHPLPIGSGWRTDVSVINPDQDTHPVPSPVPAGANLEDWYLRYPSSNHRGIVNAVFCDGHVKRISEEIDPWVYSQILSSDSAAVSEGVADWQKHFDSSGNLVPYSLNVDDLTP